MSKEYKICTRTVLDSSYPGITFSPNGECNFVEDFLKNVKPLWRPDSEGFDHLSNVVERIRASSENRDFDCIMGLSGGADSSYMLHVMVKEFGLRPLVFHVDGGWNSEIAVSNINALVDKLGIDLFTEVINWEEMRNFQLAMFKSGVPHIDTPQDLAFIGVLYRYAHKNRIKYILNGGNVSTECVPRPLKYIYWGTDMTHIGDILRQFGTCPMRTFPFSSALYHKFYLRYLHGVTVVKPLNFLRYVKDEAMALLEREYGWKPYPQKHFESRFTRFFEGYWLPQRFGFDMRRVDYSSLILTGQMTRDEALRKLENPPYDPELVRQDFDYIAAKLRIDVAELQEYFDMPQRFFWDYRNRNKLFHIGESLLWRIARVRRAGGL